MGRRSLALAAVIAAVSTADATAQTTVTVRSAPSLPNAPARLIIDARGGSANQVVPEAITILVERGFRFDRRAVAKRCTPAQARADRCPAASRIGGGEVVIRVDGPSPGAIGSGVFPGQIAAFLAPPAQPGDWAGIVLRLDIAGRTIVGSGSIAPVSPGPLGIRMAFDPLPQPPALPPGYTSTMLRMRAEIGVSRTVKVRGKRKRVIRRHLIRTPPACAGSWAVQTLVRYPEGEDVLDSTIACRRSPRRR